MQAFSAVTVLWAIALMAFVALMVYRGHLTQHEEPELFLDDNADDLPRKLEHDSIVRRVKAIEPICKAAGGATALLTVLLLGVQVVNALPYVHM